MLFDGDFLSGFRYREDSSMTSISHMTNAMKLLLKHYCYHEMVFSYHSMFRSLFLVPMFRSYVPFLEAARCVLYLHSLTGYHCSVSGLSVPSEFPA